MKHKIKTIRNQLIRANNNGTINYGQLFDNFATFILRESLKFTRQKAEKS